MDNRNPDLVMDVPFFSALVTPHRSLGRRGFFAVMAFMSVVCFLLGLMFWSLGAWPVAGFLGLDVIAIGAAFWFSYRTGRAYEEISVSRSKVHVRKVSAAGREENHSFNPRWIRLSVIRREEEGCVRVSLVGRGIDLAIGAFLNPEDRDSFARAIAKALSTARGGMTSPI